MTDRKTNTDGTLDDRQVLLAEMAILKQQVREKVARGWKIVQRRLAELEQAEH